jgi:hypothetical protein
MQRGLYRVKRPTQSKLGEHFAIGDFGNVLGLLRSRDVFHPNPVVLIEHSPPGLRYEVLPTGLSDEWTVVDRIENEHEARTHLQAAIADPQYRLLDNNCEHVTSLVATGEKKSPQLQGAVAIGGLAFLIWLLGSSD